MAKIDSPRSNCLADWTRLAHSSPSCMRVLAVVAILLATVSAHAQPSGPARILEGYALFASDSLRARGLHVESSDVGVNKGRLVASSLAAPSGHLVASKMRLGRDAVCSTAFGGEVRRHAASCLVEPFSMITVPISCRPAGRLSDIGPPVTSDEIRGVVACPNGSCCTSEGPFMNCEMSRAHSSCPGSHVGWQSPGGLSRALRWV